MKSVGFIYDDIFLQHETPARHPESKERLTAIIKKLRDSGLIKKVVNIKPRPATFAEIASVHSDRYIARIRKLGEGYLDSDTYLSAGSLDAALYAAGAVIEAVDRCKQGEISRAFCAVRPPGHHAEERSAMGFCIFNNIAIGTRYAQRHGYKKIFIIDFDVHHGNGTQHAFEEDNTVFYFSTHQFPHFPGTGNSTEKGKGQGEGFTFNLPLEPGSEDKEYIDAYRNVLPPLVKDFGPALILVSAGYDMLAGDPLSSICVSQKGLKDMLQAILGCASVPVIFILEGGYDLDALAEAVAATVRELLK
jgi:acetoin utilization deacetylase AcuC-like enzyme